MTPPLADSTPSQDSPSETLRLVKSFNNSIVLVTDEHGYEYVVLGRGIGFHKQPGDRVDSTLVERRFVPGPGTPHERVAAYLEHIPGEDLDLAEEAVQLASSRLGTSLSEHMVLPLADHISFAVRRILDDNYLEIPLRWEIASLYPREAAAARQILELVSARRGVELPPGEQVPIALHLVNGQLGGPGIPDTITVTRALSEVLQTTGQRLDRTLDPESYPAARFVTHVRYLIERMVSDRPIARIAPEVADALRTANADHYEIAGQIAVDLQETFGKEIAEDERLYLTLHVARLSDEPPVSDTTPDLSRKEYPL